MNVVALKLERQRKSTANELIVNHCHQHRLRQKWVRVWKVQFCAMFFFLWESAKKFLGFSFM